MRKYFVLGLGLILLTGCDKHDPILPGTRTAIFASSNVNVLNIAVPDLPAQLPEQNIAACPYRQDSSNVIWDGNQKIFSGFSTDNFVRSNQQPVCSGKFIYAGLTTGELVKIDSKTKKIVWIADIYRPSNMTGGASVVDIIAPIEIRKSAVYVGGLGDAFCRVNATSGDKKWCVNIGVAYPFILTDNAAFVVATDNNLYAIRLSDGAIYWRTEISKQVTPTYADKIITVGREKIDATTGNVIE